MTGDRKAVRLRVEGRVQGVGFRAFVERAAQAHGLDGWVRNRRDGGVEAVLAGPPDAVDAVVAACGVGPPAASVAMIRTFVEEGPVVAGFSVQPTA